MFDSNIITYEMHDLTEFNDIYTFINKNDDEYYGFYKFLYDSFDRSQSIFLHINKNGVETILVNRRDNIKDYFGYINEDKRNNVVLIERPYISLGFDKVNIDDNNLIPVGLDSVCLYDQQTVVFINKITGVLWLLYKTDCYHYRNGHLFFFSRVKEGRTNYVYYTKERFISDFNTQIYEPYLLNDDVDVKFTIKLDR